MDVNHPPSYNRFGCLPSTRDRHFPTTISEIHLQNVKPSPRPPKHLLPRLPLPNELLLLIIEFLNPFALDLLRLGSVSHQFLNLVNDPVLSKKIIAREKTRLLASLQEPDLTGLDLLPAFRKWLLHNHFDKLSFITAWTAANKASSVNPDEIIFLAFLLKYLIRLDRVAHHPTQKAATPSSRVRTVRCNISSFQALQEFQHGNWKDTSIPLSFLNSLYKHYPPMRNSLSEEQFLLMVHGTINEPLEQYPTGYLAQSWCVIEDVLERASMNSATKTAVEALALLTGLPCISNRDDGREVGYAFRMPGGVATSVAEGDSDALEEVNRCKGIRALRVLCWEFHGGRTKEKLLDPENRLLKAFMFEEMRVLPKPDT